MHSRHHFIALLCQKCKIGHPITKHSLSLLSSYSQISKTHSACSPIFSVFGNCLNNYKYFQLYPQCKIAPSLLYFHAYVSNRKHGYGEAVAMSLDYIGNYFKCLPVKLHLLHSRTNAIPARLSSTIGKLSTVTAVALSSFSFFSGSVSLVSSCHQDRCDLQGPAGLKLWDI